MSKILPFLLAVSFGLPTAQVWAQGNTTNDSFSKAKRMLEKEVYFDHRETFYCRAPFDVKKNVTLPEGFKTEKHVKRALRVEWEHVVPAENFGQAFVEWREGDERCVDNKGKHFKGRACAKKVNEEFRYMQADMYNLYPAIGAVNAARSNYRFQMLPGEPSSFGTCEMKISGRAVEPPSYARGEIARTMLYMQQAYSRYRMSSAQQKLMQAWNSEDPVDAWECRRAARIEELQGNVNAFVKDACLKANLPYKP